MTTLWSVFGERFLVHSLGTLFGPLFGPTLWSGLWEPSLVHTLETLLGPVFGPLFGLLAGKALRSISLQPCSVRSLVRFVVRYLGTLFGPHLYSPVWYTSLERSWTHSLETPLVPHAHSILDPPFWYII